MDFKTRVPGFHEVKMAGRGFHDDFMAKFVNHHKTSSEIKKNYISILNICMIISLQNSCYFYAAVKKQA